jgi:hypothetical protein
MRAISHQEVRMLDLWKRSVALTLVFVVAFAAFLPLDAKAQGPRAGSLTVPIAIQDFTGTFTINHFERVGNDVFAVGTVVGTRAGSSAVGVQQLRAQVQSITNGAAPAGAAAVQQLATCNILTLVLGPLHLDLLGLVVDLNQVVLTITGETGAGNLLGNLLCAIAGLLDGTGGLPIGGALNQIINLLNQILAAL